MKKLTRDEAPDLLGLAIEAEKNGNTVEALACYNRLIEIDPKSTDAWLGRARSVGWESSLDNVLVRDALVSFAYAIASAPDEEKLEVAASARSDMVSICTVVYGMARREFEKCFSNPFERQRYIKIACTISDVLEEVIIWGPRDQLALEQKALIAKDLVNLGVKPRLAMAMRQRMVEAADAMHFASA